MDPSQGTKDQDATKSDWDAEEERTRIAEGVYNGFIVRNTKTLIPKLPLPHPEFSDVYQEFVAYSLEAVELYNPGRGVAFGTFLYRHLYIRSLQLFNCSWMARNHPKGRFVTSFSQHSDVGEEGEFNERASFDPTRVRDTQELTGMVNELRASLSERALQLFDYFADLVTFDQNRGSTEILDCFRSCYSAAKVANYTGLSKNEVAEVISEISSKAMKFVPV